MSVMTDLSDASSTSSSTSSSDSSGVGNSTYGSSTYASGGDTTRSLFSTNSPITRSVVGGPRRRVGGEPPFRRGKNEAEEDNDTFAAIMEDEETFGEGTFVAEDNDTYRYDPNNSDANDADEDEEEDFQEQDLSPEAERARKRNILERCKARGVINDDDTIARTAENWRWKWGLLPAMTFAIQVQAHNDRGWGQCNRSAIAVYLHFLVFLFLFLFCRSCCSFLL